MKSDAPQSWRGGCQPGLPTDRHPARLRLGGGWERGCRRVQTLATFVGRVYSGICGVSLFSGRFQHIPHKCQTSAVPPHAVAGSSDGHLLSIWVTVGLSSQIFADKFLRKNNEGIALEPITLGSGHSDCDFIFNRAEFHHSRGSSRQQ